MTTKEAYAKGFFKKAEEHGYDPNSLALFALGQKGFTKTAQWRSLIGRGVGRYVELLLGGAGRSQALRQIGRYDKEIRRLKDVISRAKKDYIARARAEMEAARAAGRPYQELDWSHIRDLRGQLHDVMRSRAQAYRPIAPETRKVLAARWGTGLAGVGGTALYMNSHDQKKPDFGTEDYYMEE